MQHEKPMPLPWKHDSYYEQRDAVHASFYALNSKETNYACLPVGAATRVGGAFQATASYCEETSPVDCE